MVARVTDAEVRSLLAPIADDTDMSLFIGQASMLVDEELATRGLSDDRLRYIELNLAAHFGVIAVERGGITMSKTGESMERYTDNTSKVKFSSTRFGQQAIALDNTNTLTRMDNPMGNAEFKVISPTPTPYYGDC